MLNLVPGVSVPAAGSASSTAVRRLQKDYAKLMQDPVEGIKALPNEDNILEWHYCLKGSPDTPFQGGYYWGKVIFKENFPWSPPAITMITPNGRFATNTRLCLSISDYHPESWNPGWTVSAILIGLHSFMNENQPAAGSVPGSPQEQKSFAAASKEFNVKYREFRRFFPQLVKEWTGVLPTPDEPNVAPIMLPEHATPTGMVIPTIAAHSSRHPYAHVVRPVQQPMPRNMPPVVMPGPPGMVQVGGVGYGPYPPQGGMIAMQMRAREPAVGLPHQPMVNNPPLYRELAALAAMRAAAQPPGVVFALNANGVGPVPLVNPPNPPQQRVLRQRAQAQQAPRQLNDRRVELLARLGMNNGGNQGLEEQTGRGVRRAVRRGDQQNVFANNDATNPKRPRVGNF